MKNSQLLDRLGAANAYPANVEVPEQIWSNDLALHELDRRISMDTKQQTPAATEPQDKRNRGWLVAAAAFSVVVVVGLAIALATNAGSEPEQDVNESPPTAVALPQASPTLRTADALDDKVNSGDYEAYQASFAADAAVTGRDIGWGFVDQLSTDPGPSVVPASYGLELASTCTETNPTEIRCTWQQRRGIFERVGINLSANVVLLYDDNGLIVYQDVSLIGGQGEQRLLAEFFPAFGRWLKNTHPDIFDATYDMAIPELPEPFADDAIDTLESRSLWASVLDEFLAQSNTYPLDN